MDVSHEIEATDRRVGTRTLEAGTASVVTLTRSFPTDVADLWEACTDPDRLRRWFLPVSGDLRLGGRYQLEGNAGGTVTACDPPHGFDATWEMGGQVSWIELRLSPDGEGARFELAHVAHVDDDFWPTYGPGAVGIGWDLGLLGLALHIGERRTVDPAALEAWTTSAEGRGFVTAAGRAWERASVAAGVPVEEASGMADRTIAFYTGAQA